MLFKPLRFAAALALSAACALCLPSANVQAQSQPSEAADPPGYREAIDEAIAEYGAGRFPEARALFTRAHGLSPSARTLRGLGMVEFELRNYVEAARALREALASTVRPLDGELRTATEALLERTNGFLGRYALSFTPSALRLAINGVQRGDATHGTTLALPVGDHTLRAEAEGYAPLTHKLRVAGGENTALNIALQKQAVAAVPAVAPSTAAAPIATIAPQRPVTPTSKDPAPADEGDSLLSSPWFWTAAAVVVIGAGVGVGVALAGSDEAGAASPYGGSTGAVLSAP